MRVTVCSFLMAVLLSGCLGTIVETPSPQGRAIAATRIHLLASPARIDAHMCTRGVAKASTFVPLWGVAVGFFSFGIVVPKTTIYHCVEAS